MDFLEFRFPFTRIRRQAANRRDDLGNQIVAESREELFTAGWSAVTTDAPGVHTPEGQVADLMMFTRPGEVVATDAVALQGRRYSVVKVANYDHNPFGWSPGADVVTLKLGAPNGLEVGELE